jgi:tRNA threonylcarbamoyladenosine biosynthesis protein TsaB
VLLALDTSTLTLSLALVDGAGALVGEASYGLPKKQSELLPEAVSEFLGAHGARLEQLTGFLVGLGPGSFTGLRIGLATVKGLAYAVSKPIAGASSLAAAALDGPEGVPLFALSEARKGDLYLGQFVRQGTALEAFGPEVAMPVAEAGKRIAETPQSVALGPAVAAYREALRTAGAKTLLDTVLFPRAANLAHLAAVPAAFELPALFSLEPRYVMGSGAENNPKFPAPAGPEPKARLKGEEP